MLSFAMSSEQFIMTAAAVQGLPSDLAIAYIKLVKNVRKLTIFSPRLTARLRPGKDMMSILFISMRARSTVGTSSNDMVTSPRHGIVSTRGFKVILARAFNCKQYHASDLIVT